MLSPIEVRSLYAPNDWYLGRYGWREDHLWSPLSLLLLARGYELDRGGPIIDPRNTQKITQFSRDMNLAVMDLSRWLGYTDAAAYLDALQATPDDVRQRLEARRAAL